MLQESVIPLYYNNTPLGYSPEWVSMAKHSIASIMPRFNMNRMVGEGGQGQGEDPGVRAPAGGAEPGRGDRRHAGHARDW